MTEPVYPVFKAAVSQPGKNRSLAPAALLLTAGLLLLVSGLLVYWVKTRTPRQEVLADIQRNAAVAQPPPQGKTFSVFWIDPVSGRFKPFALTLPEPPGGEHPCRVYVEALLKGREGVLVPAPPQVTLRAVYRVSHRNLLVLDFHEILLHTFPGGSTAEMEFVYFLVNNICQNFPEIQKVKFLVEGNELTHLGGHLDFSRPLGPDPTFFLGEVSRDEAL